MVLFHAIGRFLLVIINLVLVLVSIALITVGVLVKYLGDSLKDFTDPVLEKIQKSAKDSFGQDEFTLEEFDLGEIFATVTSLMIGMGAVLLVISFLGSCGACCKVKCMLILYAVILIVMVLGQIVFVVFLFGYTAVLKNAMKQPLKQLLTNYKGLNATNVESLGWSFVMQEFKCCGLEGYEDFKRGDSKWFGEGDSTWKTPVPCCKTLPDTVGDFSCAQNNGHDDQYNNFNKGCVDEIWKVLIEGNTTYTYLGVGAILAFQILMIVFAFIMYYKDDENQVQPHVDNTRRKRQRNNRSGW